MNSSDELRSASTPSSPRQDARNLTLPARVIVSLRAGAVLAIANIVCVLILAWAYTHVQGGPKVITVTGSAKKPITSDLIVWRGRVSVNHPDLVQGYDALKLATEKTTAYLRAQGVADRDVKLSAVWTRKNYARDDKGNATDRVTSYDLIETVEVTSTDVARVSDVARTVTGLIKEGVMLESEAPQYLYTKLADLKIEMLAEATKDATARAEQIAGNSGATLGSIRDARMGVMQINPAHAGGVSDSGNNDTTSLEKEITAVVSARFELE
jgi:uncharacterized protein